MADPRDSRGPLQVFEATPSQINDQLRIVRDELDELHNATAAITAAADPDSAFVIVSADAALANARHLAAGTGISVTDGGAGGAITVAASGASPTDATYVVVSANATLTDERVLTAGTGITLTDAGAGGTLTIAATAATTIYDRVTADTTVNNTATETTIYTKSITGGDLSTNKRLRLTLHLKLGDTSAGAAAATLAFRLKFGASTIATATLRTNDVDGGVTLASIPANTGYILTCILSADGATNAQVGNVGIQGPIFAALTATPAIGIVGILSTATTANGTGAIDSTTAQTLLVSAQWSAANAGRLLTMQHALLELL